MEPAVRQPPSPAALFNSAFFRAGWVLLSLATLGLLLAPLADAKQGEKEEKGDKDGKGEGKGGKDAKERPPDEEADEEAEEETEEEQDPAEDVEEEGVVETPDPGAGDAAVPQDDAVEDAGVAEVSGEVSGLSGEEEETSEVEVVEVAVPVAARDVVELAGPGQPEQPAPVEETPADEPAPGPEEAAEPGPGASGTSVVPPVLESDGGAASKDADLYADSFDSSGHEDATPSSAPVAAASAWLAVNGVLLSAAAPGLFWVFRDYRHQSAPALVRASSGACSRDHASWCEAHRSELLQCARRVGLYFGRAARAPNASDGLENVRRLNLVLTREPARWIPRIPAPRHV